MNDTPTDKKLVGFALLDPERRAEIARKGRETSARNRAQQQLLGTPSAKTKGKPTAPPREAMVPAAKRKIIALGGTLYTVLNEAVATARIVAAARAAEKATNVAEDIKQDRLHAQVDDIHADKLDEVETAMLAVETVELAWRYPRSRAVLERIAAFGGGLGLAGVLVVIAVPRLARRNIIPGLVQKMAQPFITEARKSYAGVAARRPVPAGTGGAPGRMGTDPLGQDDTTGPTAPAPDAPLPPSAAGEGRRVTVPGDGQNEAIPE